MFHDILTALPVELWIKTQNFRGNFITYPSFHLKDHLKNTKQTTKIEKRIWIKRSLCHPSQCSPCM